MILGFLDESINWIEFEFENNKTNEETTESTEATDDEVTHLPEA